MDQVAAVVLAGTLALGTTQGQAAPTEEVGQEPPMEIARTLGQVGLGATVATAGLFLVGATLDAEGGPFIFMLATPAAVGAAVCAVGERGAYHGSCLVAGAGAYLGAASIVPLVYFSNLVFRDPAAEGAGFIIPTQVVFAFLAGWVVVQPVVATFGWRIFADLKPPPPPRISVTAPRRPNGGPRALVLPLLAFGF
jgi:hypothetical protein